MQTFELKVQSSKISGYVLLDVLMAIFLFAIGFLVLYGLVEGAIRETQQAANLNQAANIAQGVLEDLNSRPWPENLAEGACVPGGLVEGQEGNYRWSLQTNWDTLPTLLRLNLEINWQDQGQIRKYSLESLYNVE